jgi:hypothetical protein
MQKATAFLAASLLVSGGVPVAAAGREPAPRRLRLDVPARYLEEPAKTDAAEGRKRSSGWEEPLAWGVLAAAVLTVGVIVLKSRGPDAMPARTAR